MSPDRSWKDLKPPLSPWILSAVRHMGYEKMTPVQASAIPLFMGNSDVVVEAVTGSGKTLAFLIPVIERILRSEEPHKKNHVSTVIVSPTRELAAQIFSVLQSLLLFHSPPTSLVNHLHGMDGLTETHRPEENSDPKIAVQLVVGGNVTPAEDLARFLDVSPNILVGTPGRLLNMLSAKHVKCVQSNFDALVLDEVDRLLDLGFSNDLQNIINKLPKQRRNGVFSASAGEAVDQLVRLGLRNPVKIVVKVKDSSGKGTQRMPTSLQLRYLSLPASHKFPALCHVLRYTEPPPSKSIIYLSTCAAVDYFQYVLPTLLRKYVDDLDLFPLHGKLLPHIRENNLSKFVCSQRPAVLLTTDVAARGLDIPQVDLTLQVDPPNDPKAFLHRCGRAGRAGKKGMALIFLQSGREEDYVRFLDIRKTPVIALNRPKIAIESKEPLQFAAHIREQVKADRGLHEKAQRAFVSWVRSYTKHHAQSIFRVSDQDWYDLAAAWGLLKLPKMPELRDWSGDRMLGLEIDFDTLAYSDIRREQSRIASIQSASSTLHKSDHSPRKTRAWSHKHAQKQEREMKRAKRKKRQEYLQSSKMSPGQRNAQSELQDLVRRVKHGRIGV